MVYYENKSHISQYIYIYIYIYIYTNRPNDSLESFGIPELYDWVTSGPNLCSRSKDAPRARCVLNAMAPQGTATVKDRGWAAWLVKDMGTLG